MRAGIVVLAMKVHPNPNPILARGRLRRPFEGEGMKLLCGVYPEPYAEILRFAQNDNRRRARNDNKSKEVRMTQGNILFGVRAIKSVA
jgi:hypothetical protein